MNQQPPSETEELVDLEAVSDESPGESAERAGGAEHGLAEHGLAEHGGAEQGRAEQGGAEQGGAEQGRAEQGRAEQGGSSRRELESSEGYSSEGHSSEAYEVCQDPELCEADCDARGEGTGRRRRPDPAAHWVYFWVSLAIIVLAVILQVPDDQHVVVPLINQPVPGVCTFKRMVGVGCPGCGLTRCLITLAKGDLARAWSFNPVGILVAVLLVAQLPYRLLQLRRIRRGLPEISLRGLTNGLVLGTAAALFVQWLVRLLLGQPL